MTEDDWHKVIAVHLTGTHFVSKAAWPLLREGGYGRVVNTTSAAGLYGNFGQANYSAAKMGIVGLTKTLAQEGAKYDIKANVIAPVAKSRMTETILPPNVLEKLQPEAVAPLVAYLASDRCQDNGQIFAVGGGYVAKVAVVEGAGVSFPSDRVTPEGIAERWSEISDLGKARPFANAMEAAQVALENAKG
jgi:NAD(P)-dependent dehydrogenase (short-subunit alcohol dehydrogenase family)